MQLERRAGFVLTVIMKVLSRHRIAQKNHARLPILAHPPALLTTSSICSRTHKFGAKVLIPALPKVVDP